MRRIGAAIGFALFALFSGAGAGPAVASSGIVPTITNGVPPAIGATLTAAPNASAPTDTVGWEVCGTYAVGDPFTGTANPTYTLSAADVGKPVCAVELDSSNNVDGISDGEAPPGLSASGAPVTEGDTITLTQGAWGSAPGTLTLTDTWNACSSGGTCTPVTPAPGGPSFTVGRAEVGDTIIVAETSSGGGSVPATTLATGTVAATPPAALSTPTISGTTQVGDRLTASPGSWSNSPTDYAYQWERCASGLSCTPIAGATGSTYVPVAADAGDVLVVAVAGLIDPGQPYGSAGQPVWSYPVAVPLVAPAGGSGGGSSGGTPPPAGISTSGPPPPVLPPAPVVQVTPSAPKSAIGRLTASMQWTFRYAPRVTQVISLAVEGPAIGSIIATRCRGAGCPFRLHRIRVRGLKRCRMAGRTHCRAPRAINLAWEFHRRRLHVGAVVTVAISRRHDIGRYYRFAVRRRRGPAVRISCLAPGSFRPRRSCAAS